jgi:hypothetical protein
MILKCVADLKKWKTALTCSPFYRILTAIDWYGFLFLMKHRNGKNNPSGNSPLILSSTATIF